MQVQVRLFATLRQGRFNRQWMDLSAGESIGDLLRLLGIPEEDVGMLLLDGHDTALNTLLEDKAVISVFPALGGG